MMTGRLDGECAMVTGGGNGIGRAICELFSKEGADVAIVDVDENGSSETLRLLKKGKNHTIKADVTNANDVRKAFKISEEKFGRKFDIVVSNAGIASGKSCFTSDLDEKDFDKVISVNLKGVFLVGKEYLRSVEAVDQNVRGILINTSSVFARIAPPRTAAYSSAKAGVIALTKTIVNEFSAYRVRCNAVMPGMTLTSMLENIPPDRFQMWLGTIPLQRAATPEEIAHGFLYLASEESSYIHGTCLEINGGV